MALHDPERWAEFIIILGGKYPSGVNDIAVIDGEVMKVKEASSKPFYTSSCKADAAPLPLSIPWERRIAPLRI